MDNEEKVLILQLKETDAYRVLSLVQREAANGPVWSEYYETLARQILADLQAQQAGQFFQCAACKT